MQDKTYRKSCIPKCAMFNFGAHNLMLKLHIVQFVMRDLQWIYRKPQN